MLDVIHDMSDVEDRLNLTLLAILMNIKQEEVKED